LAQLSLKSNAFHDSAPIPVSELRLQFAGSLRPIVLSHDPSAASTGAKPTIKFSSVALKEAPQGEEDQQSTNTTTGKADLLLAPGQTMVYEMAIPLREPGEAKAVSMKASVKTEDFWLDYVVAFRDDSPRPFWIGPTGSKKKIGRADSHCIGVEARPPKMDINLGKHREQYYSNESIDLELELANAEDDDAVAKLDIHVFGDQVPGGKIHVAGIPEVLVLPHAEASKVAAISVGTLRSSEKVPIRISLDAVSAPTSLDIAVRVSYHLVSDPVTPVIQKKTFQVTVSNPFEANYDLVPRLHADTWPSLFDPSTIQDVSEDAKTTLPPLGLAQRWCLTCHYASFATEDLHVVDLEAQIAKTLGNARCTTRKPDFPADGIRIPPRTMQEASIDMFAQKISLDDRGAASVDLALVIKWRRVGSDAVNTTTMYLPRHIILGIEPRVLASLAPVEDGEVGEGLVNLNLTIENASSHLLTFGLNMEPSDEFAFSGAKKTTVHLLPVSRRTVTYSLLPLVTGKFIRPTLIVRDKYYQKTLRIIPTEGMKIDKDGLLVWIPADGSEDKAGSNDETELSE
jgi:trafficking protein particle complex subunit 11